MQETTKEKTIKMQRVWAMPNARTFTIKPIKEFVKENVKGQSVIIDPFANQNKFGTITNDLNPEFDTMFHLDALEFLKMQKSDSADCVLFDPPYNATQAAECYKAYGKEKLEINVGNGKYWAECKKEVSRILKIGGIALCFGWNSSGIGKSNGMELQEVLLVAHGGRHYDTICTKEVKINNIPLFTEAEK
jgi:hypothetical protein